MTERRALLASLAAIIALTLVLYGRSVKFGFSGFDDDLLVLTDQRAGTPPPSVWAALGKSYFPAADRDHAYYRPLVSASYALDAKVSGAAPSSYHATNVLWHALASALVLLLMRSFGYALPVALFGAAVFAAHPALAGAVCWIPGRDDLMLGAFGLASWLCFRRASGPRGAPRVWLLHGVAWFFALACKEAALALPLVFLLDALVLERRSLKATFSPWLAVVWGVPLGAYLVLRGLVLGPTLGLGGLGAGAFFGGFRGLVAGLGALVIPREPQVLAVPDDMPFGRGLLVLAFAGLVLWRSRALRPLGFALAGYLVLSLPSLPALSRLLLESRLYLPAVPLVVALCEVARQSRSSSQKSLVVGSFVVGALALMASRHAGELTDRLAFAEAASVGSPHSSLAHRNLGIACQRLGQAERARREYQLALAADPDEPMVHNNLAVLLMAEGHLAEAESELHAELLRHPGTGEAVGNLALVERALGRVPAPVSP